MATLREYQVSTINMLFDAIKRGAKNILIVLSCGAGKSTIFAKVFEMCFRNQKRALFIVHRRGLVNQFHERLEGQFGIKAGIIMSKLKATDHIIQVASIQTLKSREFPEADIVIIDEAHNVKADQYQAIIKHYMGRIIVGMTATPERLDGSPLGDVFPLMINPIKMNQLIEQGYLVPTECYEPDVVVDLTKVKKSMGDFNEKELFVRYDKYSVYNEIVNFYKKVASGRRMIMYCVNVEHSIKMSNAFNAAGIPSRHVDGDTSDEERKEITELVEKKQVMVVTNCAVYIEGTDIPSIECTGLAMGTMSKTRFVQMIGRCQRSYIDIFTNESKKVGIVLDFGGNVSRHGYVEDYDLAGFDLHTKKKDRIEQKDEPSVKRCLNCGVLNRMNTSKCKCGYVFKVREKDVVLPITRIQVRLIDRNAKIVEGIITTAYSKLKHSHPGKLLLIELVMQYNMGWAVLKAMENDERLKDLKYGQVMHYLEGEERKIGYHHLRNEMMEKGVKVQRGGVKKEEPKPYTGPKKWYNRRK